MSAKRFATSTEAASLLTSYNLKEEHYSKEVGREHLIKFIKYYGHTWRNEHLYKHLVSNSKTIISDIENEQKYSEEDRRHEFFLKWQKVWGSEATYAALVNALLKAKCEDCEKGAIRNCRDRYRIFLLGRGNGMHKQCSCISARNACTYY